MSLKRKYAGKEEIPQGLEKFYVEQDGAFTLDLEGGFKTDDDVANVKKALDKERADHKAAKEQLKKFEGIDPEAMKAEREEFEELKAKGGKIDEAAVEARIKARFERDASKLQQQLAEREQTIAQFNAERKANSVKDSLRSAASKLKVRKEAEDDVLARAGMFELDAEGKVITKDGCGVAPGLTAEQWLEETLKGKPHWSEPSRGAGAKTPSGSPPPSDKPASTLDLITEAWQGAK